MMALANIADGTIALCCSIRCELRLATGRMVSCGTSVIRLYVCKELRGPIDMNLAVIAYFLQILYYFDRSGLTRHGAGML